MHELSLSTAIVDTVERHAAGRRVTAVSMRIGHLRQVVPESLAFYFGVVSRGTLCEDARLEHEVVAVELRCERCGRRWKPELPAFRCPGCDGGAVEALSGDEFEVESIELAGPAAAGGYQEG